MRILVLTNLYPPHYLGGYELICWMAVNELRQRGHHLRVFTSDHRVAGMEGQAEEPQVDRILKVHGFYGHPWRNIIGLAQLEAFNNSCLVKAIREWQPELVYVWNMGGLSKSLLFQLQRTGLPVVFYVSDHWIARGLSADVWLNWWNGRERSWTQRLARNTLGWTGVRRRWEKAAATDPIERLQFRRISFCSRALRELTAAAGFEVNHGAVIYAPVDLTRFRGRNADVCGTMERLLFAGRLSADKGVMTALRALALLRGKFRGQLNIYGRGDAGYEDQLRRFVEEQRLPVNFRSAHLEEMPRVYAEHDCLIFPSEWAEPFALTPLEAMASGTPVIGTMTGGSAELFRHGENCLTYPAGDASLLAERISQFAKDAALRQRCAAAGYCEAREKYSVPAVVNEIEQYLSETLETWEPAKAAALIE